MYDYTYRGRERERRGDREINGFVLNLIWNWIRPISKQRKMSRKR